MLPDPEGDQRTVVQLLYDQTRARSGGIARVNTDLNVQRLTDGKDYHVVFNKLDNCCMPGDTYEIFQLVDGDALLQLQPAKVLNASLSRCMRSDEVAQYQKV